jgi:uncharacterized protein YyaL (SSP411 family)
MTVAAHTNALEHSTSPYLQQHAHNPVAWRPWGDEAVEAARREDKPLLVSIGYASCHWCHVMAHESFEDEATARFLNEHFVPVKVDREERPDLDEIYMTAMHLMTGRGGWPLNVFLTPDLKPFYGGTYWPPVERLGPSFRRVLESVARAYRDNRAGVEASAEDVAIALARALDVRPAGGVPDDRLIGRAAAALRARFDAAWGGFGGAPKFPQPTVLRLLLAGARRTGSHEDIDMVTATLDAMARGGVYDQLGGGFHRYSVDARWRVPHFEKMLYDNALLAVAYLEAFQAAGRPLHARVARETLDWMLREMRDAGGGLHSALDADTDGEEGRFYVWTRDEVDAVLGDEAYRRAAADVAHFIRRRMIAPDGGLLHAFRGGRAHTPGMLDDYAYVLAGLVDLYEAAFDPAVLAEAVRLAGEMLRRFAARGGGLYQTQAAQPHLLTRIQRATDGATPSGAGTAAHALLRLAALTGRQDFADRARDVLAATGGDVASEPAASAAMLLALDFALGPVTQVAIIGPHDERGTQGLLAAVRGRYRPRTVVAWGDPAAADFDFDLAAASVPWLAGRGLVGDRPAAYVCHDGSCLRPVTTAEALGDLLDQA